MIACVGGGSNAIGMFAPFVDDAEVELVGVEAAGEGIESGRHGAPLTVGGRGGRPARRATRRSCRTRTARSSRRTRSRPASTTPATGPEHAYLRDSGRARYVAVTDDAGAGRVPAARAQLEGIIPALETAHAVAWVLGAEASADTVDLICLSGRGDKDLAEALDKLGVT